jgi:CheY-like chemotaxis protein
MADVELVAACRDVDELRAAVDDTSPDIVLTEIPMPPSMTDEGLRLAAELRINQRTVERQIHTIFEKLELPSTPDVNRRVRAVLLYLATAGATGGR